MRLEQLECLISIAEVGSFREAARRFNLSQPAISKMISSLEIEVGTPLLIRTARGATLTAAGSAIVTRARVISSEARKISEDARQFSDGDGMVVRVGLTAACSHALLAPVLTKFLKQMPRARLQLVDSSFNSIYAQLRNRDLDFAICPLSSSANGRDIDSTALFSSAMTPVCMPQHPLRGASSIKDLMGEIWTWAEDGDGGVVSDAFRDNNLEKPFSVVSDSFSSRLQMILACNAIALFPTILLESNFLRERIAPIWVREHLPEARYYLVRSAHSPLTTQAELLAKLFAEQAGHVRAAQVIRKRPGY